ncbi:MAG: hypothetical protein OEZ02_14885 [Anaerolineae bacterium]|nr:hypothetical protein [Anaerolineae bacterium]
MNNRLDARDLKLLSAYMDGQLSTRQRKKLELRLAAESGLRDALKDLRQTRSLLRQTLSLKPRRSFMLTPEMAGKPSLGGEVYLSMRLVSALASVLFVLVIAGDLIMGGARQVTGVSLSAPEEAAPMLAEGDDLALGQADSNAYTEKSAEPLLPTYLPAAEEATEEPAELSSEAAADEAAEEATGEETKAPPTATPPPKETKSGDAVSPKNLAGSQGATATLRPNQRPKNRPTETPTPKPTATPTLTQTPEPTATMTLTETPANTATQEPAATQQAFVPDDDQTQAGEGGQQNMDDTRLVEPEGALQPAPKLVTMPFSVFRIAEVLLAVIALLAGGLAYYFKKVKRF